MRETERRLKGKGQSASLNALLCSVRLVSDLSPGEKYVFEIITPMKKPWVLQVRVLSLILFPHSLGISISSFSLQGGDAGRDEAVDGFHGGSDL